jgi:hypothetical protein
VITRAHLRVALSAVALTFLLLVGWLVVGIIGLIYP